MADAVASRMRRAGLVGRTVGLKIRYGDFVTLTRSRTCPAGLSDGPLIAADRHLSPGRRRRQPRRPAARCRRLQPQSGRADASRAEQMRFELASRSEVRHRAESWHRASGAVDAVRDRFGDEAVGPARLLAAGGLQVKRPGDTQWGPSAGGRKSTRADSN